MMPLVLAHTGVVIAVGVGVDLGHVGSVGDLVGELAVDKHVEVGGGAAVDEEVGRGIDEDEQVGQGLEAGHV